MHAGKNKVLNDPFLPQNEEGQKILTRILSQIHQSFIQHVKDNRGDRQEGSFGDLADFDFFGSITNLVDCDCRRRGPLSHVAAEIDDTKF